MPGGGGEGGRHVIMRGRTKGVGVGGDDDDGDDDKDGRRRRRREREEEEREEVSLLLQLRFYRNVMGWGIARGMNSRMNATTDGTWVSQGRGAGVSHRHHRGGRPAVRQDGGAGRRHDSSAEADVHLKKFEGGNLRLNSGSALGGEGWTADTEGWGGAGIRATWRLPHVPEPGTRAAA